MNRNIPTTPRAIPVTTSGLGPVRGRIRVCAVVEASTSTAVRGKKARPEVIGEKWRFSCMKNVRKKNTPKIPAAASRIERYAPPRARSRTMCSGSSGWLERRSIKTNVISNTGAATSAMIVVVAVQECASALEKP